MSQWQRPQPIPERNSSSHRGPRPAIIEIAHKQELQQSRAPTPRTKSYMRMNPERILSSCFPFFREGNCMSERSCRRWRTFRFWSQGESIRAMSVPCWRPERQPSEREHPSFPRNRWNGTTGAESHRPSVCTGRKSRRENQTDQSIDPRSDTIRPQPPSQKNKENIMLKELKRKLNTATVIVPPVRERTSGRTNITSICRRIR